MCLFLLIHGLSSDRSTGDTQSNPPAASVDPEAWKVYRDEQKNNTRQGDLGYGPWCNTFVRTTVRGLIAMGGQIKSSCSASRPQERWKWRQPDPPR